MNKLRKLSLLACTIGIIVSLYLTYARITSNPLVCGLGDCGKVQASPFATFLGIPLAYWGLAYYFALFSALYKNLKISFYLVSWGLLFSMYLLGLEIFVIKATCMWCMFSLFIILCLSISELTLKQKAKRKNKKEIQK
jgi:uncharacterized membrane protein